MMNPKMLRRTLLGASAGLGLSALFRGASRAQSALLPSRRRFVVFFTPNEPIAEEYWKPQGGAGDEFALASSTLPAPIDELNGITDHLLMMGDVRLDNPGYDHAAIGVVLTGVPNEYPSGDKDQNAAVGGGISLDQLLGERLGETPLVLGVRSRGQNGTSRLSYAGARRPVTPFDDPQTAFDSVFGQAFVPDEEAEARARRLAQRRSVLDATAGQLSLLRARLPGEQGRNLDHHLEALRGLEAKLASDGTDLESCFPFEPGDTRFDQPDEATRTARRQMDLMVETLRCGARNIGVLQLGTSGDMFSSDMVSEDDGLNLGSRHEHVDLIHGWEDQVADRVALERVYYRLFREFIEKLQLASDSDGASLLDNTVVLWCKSLGYRHDGKHGLYMLAGGANSGITKRGQFVNVGGRYQNDLLVSCLGLMEQPDTTFGDPAWNSGKLIV